MTIKNAIDLVLPELAKNESADVQELIKRLGLLVQNDSSELEAVVLKVLEDQKKSLTYLEVYDYIEKNSKKETYIIFTSDHGELLGENGSGKTTLIRMLLKDSSLEESIYNWGSKLNIGYLAQEVKFNDESLSVLDYFMNEHEVSQNRARTELAKALFIRDDVFKSIKNLSGGEKSKLKLCSLTFNNVNFMILDEPTNHLDIDSREILEDLLLEFDGTILFVSHDRYFIKKIANRIGEINNLSLKYYEGDYDYYKHIKLRDKEDPVKKERVRTKYVNDSETSFDYSKRIDELESLIINIESLMEEFAYDAGRLNELYIERAELEMEYDDLISKM